jgi:hypothetical protein
MKRILFALATALVALRASAYYPQFTRTSVSNAYQGWKMRSGDFNADGRPDMMIASGNSSVRMSLAQPDGSLDAATIVHTAAYLSDFDVADIDGDQKSDVVVADTGTNTLVFLHGNGDETFATPVNTALTFAPTQIATGDYTGDGKLDVAIRSYSAAILAIYAGDGAGHFSEAWRTGLGDSVLRMANGDIDGDGKLDVLIAYANVWRYDLYYGRGDGTFDAPVSLASPADYPYPVVLADLDGDGDAEILSTQFDPGTVTVILNLGGRAFAAPQTYSPHMGNPVDLVVADFTGDGKPDVMAAMTNSIELVTFPGNGDGTLGAPAQTPIPSVSYYSPSWPSNLVVADFSGDGKPDVAVSSSSANRVSTFANTSGQAVLDVVSKYPTLTVGQTTTVTVSVLPLEQLWYLQPTPPTATGTVTLREGATILGSAPLQQLGTATINLSSLSAGTHQLVASYSGDANWAAAEGQAFAQVVTTERTTLTIASNRPGEEVRYGEDLMFLYQLTSTLPGSLDQGPIWLYIDGQRQQYATYWPSYYSFSVRMPVGTHSIYAVFEGTATQPPTVSPTVTQIIRKASTTTSLQLFSTLVRAGAPANANYVFVSSTCCSSPQSPSVRIYEGSQLLLTANGNNNFALPNLPIGVHYLRAVYDGDQNYEGSQSAPVRFTVVAGDPFVVDVTAPIGSNVIGVQAYVTTFYPRYDLYRRIDSGPWTLLQKNAPLSTTQTSSLPGTVYAYRMEAFDGSGNLAATSNTDLAMVQTYTDDPLATGMVVKAVHVQEVLAAANTLRAAAGLAPVALTNFGAGQLVQAAHILALRIAVNEGRVAFGANAFNFTDALAAGTTVKAKDIQDLREAMR